MTWTMETLQKRLAGSDVVIIDDGLPTGGAVLHADDNALRGRNNRIAGEQLEHELNAYHWQIETDGLAVVRKMDLPTRYNGNGTVVVTGSAIVDYVAFLAGGHSVHFDAKSRASNQGFSVSARDLHQLDWLRRVAALGHPAGYVVRWTAYSETRWHDVSTVDGQRVRYDDGLPLCGVEWLTVVKDLYHDTEIAGSISEASAGSQT